MALNSLTPSSGRPHLIASRTYNVRGILIDREKKVAEMDLLEHVRPMFFDGLLTVNRSCVIHQNRILHVKRGQGGGIAVVVCPVNFPLLFFSRIVSRIDEGNTSRAGEVNLEDYLLVRCPGMMNVICRKHEN